MNKNKEKQKTKLRNSKNEEYAEKKGQKEQHEPMLSSTAFSESLTAIEESNLRPVNTLSNADWRKFGLSLRCVL